MARTDKLFDFVRVALKDGCSLDELDAQLEERFGETCATLVLDSTGFTRTTKVMGTGFFLSIIQQMRSICETITDRFGAIQSRSYADNYFAEFATVDEAVAAAFALHQHFDDNPVSLLGEKDHFGVSIGIGYGRVVRSEHEGVYGNEMNYASKLGEDTAKRGETLLTEAAYNALANPQSVVVEKTSVTTSGVQMPVYSLAPKPA